MMMMILQKQLDAADGDEEASGTWDMTASYVTESGVKEVYNDMLQDCYGITLSHLTQWGPSHLMCSLCASHLRDANTFREQVLQADKHFTAYWSRPEAFSDVPIKCEGASPHSDSAEPPYTDDESNITLNSYISPEKSKALRKREKSGVKSKRERKKISSDDDYDSDVPISLLVKDGDMGRLEGKKETDVRTKDQNKPLESKTSKIKSQNYIDNRELRSNITLILKYSSVIPFRHVNNSKYACLYCANEYLLFNKLKKHVISIHNDLEEDEITACLKTPKDLVKADINDLICKLCKDKFLTIDNFVEHLTGIHNKVYYSLSRVNPSHGILAFDLSSENLKCLMCSKEFRFFKNLSMHMNEHSTNFMCHRCGKNFVSDHRLQTHVIMHNKKNINCKHCNKSFKTVSARNYHIKKVHSEVKYKCSECSQTFEQYYQRLRHLVDSHDMKKPKFKCHICEKELATSGGLAAHIRYSHLKTTQYTCELCGKLFVYKWIWQRHMAVHSGAKNFECKVCNKKFAKSYTLQMHTRIHMNDKRFSCDVCKTAFIQKCSLKNHFKVHHPETTIE
ncbi:zinc finger protein 540-like isoform X2 [Galleria mellonella]|uniref:Zinc finger protein 540-like isoform X2 n=1 Tax=Galleria mellonella TaxID=7137 RepID=A0A6J3C3T6_GALME|nr:zinc finger protein 540-like isoform X2 [Galleria mellonella]